MGLCPTILDMFARHKTFWCRRMAAWQLLFCLTVFAFMCRAFIPVGYMPDLSGERQSTFAITLCSMGSATVIQVDLSGEPAEPGHDQHYSGENCPFGLSVVQKLMPGHAAPALAGAASIHSFVVPVAYQALPPLPSLGPPLGSRAPPASSGLLRA